MTTLKAAATTVRNGVAEIYLYGEIADDGGDVTTTDIRAALEKARDASKIILHINSPGGNVFDGIAIRSLLLKSRKRIEVEIDGLAASIASVIAMVGVVIRMPVGAKLMVHNAWTGVVGDHREMRKTADVAEGVTIDIARIYAERTGLAVSKVQSLMDAESWLDAAEAKRLGFIDEIAGTRSIAARADLSKFNYTRIPEELLVPAENTVAYWQAKIDEQMAFSNRPELLELCNRKRAEEATPVEDARTRLERRRNAAMPRASRRFRPNLDGGTRLYHACIHESAHAVASAMWRVGIVEVVVQLDGSGETLHYKTDDSEAQIRISAAGWLACDQYNSSADGVRSDFATLRRNGIEPVRLGDTYCGGTFHAYRRSTQFALLCDQMKEEMRGYWPLIEHVAAKLYECAPEPMPGAVIEKLYRAFAPRR